MLVSRTPLKFNEKRCTGKNRVSVQGAGCTRKKVNVFDLSSTPVMFMYDRWQARYRAFLAIGMKENEAKATHSFFFLEKRLYLDIKDIDKEFIKNTQ